MQDRFKRSLARLKGDKKLDQRVTVDETSDGRHCIFVLEEQVDGIVRVLKPEEIETIEPNAVSAGPQNHAEIMLSEHADISEIQARLDLAV